MLLYKSYDDQLVFKNFLIKTKIYYIDFINIKANIYNYKKLEPKYQ